MLFIGWNRAIPGREKLALELFREAVAFYLASVNLPQSF